MNVKSNEDAKNSQNKIIFLRLKKECIDKICIPTFIGSFTLDETKEYLHVKQIESLLTC